MEKLPDTRVGAAERDRAVGFLSEHMAAERLTKEEFETRVEAAYRAASQSDLCALFADLPAPIWEAGVAGASPDVVGPAAVPARGTVSKTEVVANALFPATGLIGIVLAVLTGSWYWLLLLPPAVYGVRQVARKARRRRTGEEGGGEGRSGPRELE